MYPGQSIIKMVAKNLRKTQNMVRAEEYLNYNERCVNVILPSLEGRQLGKEEGTHREGNG